MPTADLSDGYTSVSSFIAAFKRRSGVTSARYAANLRQDRGIRNRGMQDRGIRNRGIRREDQVQNAR